VLPPPSGWLNLVHVDAEMMGRRKYGDYIRKLARVWVNHSTEGEKGDMYRVHDLSVDPLSATLIGYSPWCFRT
jgi:hypothetical protein